MQGLPLKIFQTSGQLLTTGGGSLQVFGSAGNLLFGAGYTASIISSKKELLPQVDADGWYHIPRRGDASQAKWPQPTPPFDPGIGQIGRHSIQPRF